jgi:hypothetical protein
MLMKIELKLKIDTIFAINKLLQTVYDVELSTAVNQKIYRSIGFDLADKFDKLEKSNIKKATLFDNKKIHKVTLKFHEGWALYNIIINLLPTVNNHQAQTILQATADKIHQQL